MPCGAFQRHGNIFGEEWQIVGQIQRFKLGATEAVNQRVQQTVHVGQDHEAVEGHGGFVLSNRVPVLDPGDQEDHPGYSAGQEADGEDHHDRGDQEHRPPQLGFIPDGFLLEPLDDVDRAVDQDDEGDEDLGEEDHLSRAVYHVLD